MKHLKYPIGQVNIPTDISEKDLENWISTIEHFPTRLQNLTNDLSEEQLDTPYRQGGWSIRQVVHHCYDSHHNSYTRFKWALTEEQPLIKAYYEDRWAELFDSKLAPISLSINGIIALHAKWTYLLKGLNETDLNKMFIHPETGKKNSLKATIGVYHWHCNHHYAHIEQLCIRKNWK
ncbi:YfiT family bacillithiol transferase [Polaribacter pacificus]|uniref:YfiT family bacillithiol transferase n=1 Tax=Polaribacter pacificus TaxID=1775173 RepID=UPI001E2FA7B1|nr:putative metal-dependent hydrolase [Polaribacter pacificus]